MILEMSLANLNPSEQREFARKGNTILLIFVFRECEDNIFNSCIKALLSILLKPFFCELFLMCVGQFRYWENQRKLNL